MGSGPGSARRHPTPGVIRIGLDLVGPPSPLHPGAGWRRLVRHHLPGKARWRPGAPDATPRPLGRAQLRFPPSRGRADPARSRPLHQQGDCLPQIHAVDGSLSGRRARVETQDRRRRPGRDARTEAILSRLDAMPGHDARTIAATGPMCRAWTATATATATAGDGPGGTRAGSRRPGARRCMMPIGGPSPPSRAVAPESPPGRVDPHGPRPRDARPWPPPPSATPTGIRP